MGGSWARAQRGRGQDKHHITGMLELLGFNQRDFKESRALSHVAFKALVYMDTHSPGCLSGSTWHHLPSLSLVVFI